MFPNSDMFVGIYDKRYYTRLYIYVYITYNGLYHEGH